MKTHLKNLCAATLILVLLVSNVPQDMFGRGLEYLVDKAQASLADANVVDALWKASQDGNVVDSLKPLRALAQRVQTPKALAVANGDGKLFYSISANSTPRARDYVSATNSFSAAVSTVAGSTALQSVIKASPTQDEMVAGYVNSSGTLQVMCWNGTSWTNEWSVAAGGTGTTRRFDIAYEKTTGDVMVAYSTNAATTNELAYRTKAGSTACGTANWSAATNYDAVRTAGIVQWVRLEGSPVSGSNTIALAWADAASDLSAMEWTGASFAVAEPTAVLEATLEYATAAQDAESFDIAFENTTGYLMVAWGVFNSASCTAGTNCMRYARYTTTWSAITNFATIADTATHIDLATDYAASANNILLGAVDNNTGDLSRGVWSGSAWTNAANADTTVQAPTAGTKFISVGWLNNGATKRGVLVYYDSATTNVGWMTVSGTTWTAQTDWAPTPVFGAQRQYEVEADPFNLDRLIFVVQDTNSDIFAKRLIMDSAGVFTWSNADAGVALETTTGSATYKSSNYEYNRYIPVASQSITIGVTAGSKVTNLNSGDTSQYMQTTSCASASACAAFTLSLNSGSDTVTSIKLTETGTANASSNLSNVALFYDTDGNYSNGVTGQYGSTVASFTSETATVSGSLALTAGTTYYFYVRTDIKSATPTYPAGGETINFQIAATGDVTVSGASTKTGAPVSLAGTTTVRPQVTGYTNSTEAGLNYAASCTGCGARLGGGSGFRQTLVLSGYGFGTDPGLGSRDTATNKVEIVGGATTVLADDASANTNVSAWSNTSITIRTDTSITTNADTDWGANFGGATALKITAGSQAVPTNLNFYLFPQVTSITTNTGVADGAREYAAADTDGVITLNGTRFGSAQGTGYVRMLGCDVTTCTSPTGSVTIDSWTNTAIQARVPTIIADNTYTGSILMQQGTGGNSKTHTYANTFRILPRITGFTPTGGSVGDAVTVNGDHFCENAAVCPTVFGVNDAVTFTSSVAATVFTSWTSTAMQTQVPTGAVTGGVVLKSNAFNSNSSSFTVTSPTPNDPTSLNQYKNSGLTQAIATGDSASSTPIYLTMTMQVGVSGGTLYPQIEYKAIGTAFACSGTGACGSATEGTGVAGPGPIDCSVGGNNCSISISPADNVYHWQARVRHNKNAVDYYSAWVSFPTPTPNLESETDFKIDTTVPAITNVQSTNVLSNSATITWDTSGEQSTSQVQYNTTGTFGACAGDCTTLDTNVVFSHSVGLANLNSGTTYYYRVRSKDAAGNESISSNSTFATASVTQPAKTTRFHIGGLVGSVSGGTATSSDFSVVLPETAPSVKSAFVEVRTIYNTTGSAPNGVTVQVGTETARTYALPTGASDIGHIKILHPVTSIPIDPATTTLSVTPETNTSLYILSSDIYVTYGYTP